MAGAFTHFIISNLAKSKRSILGRDLWQLLNRHYQFLFLGSASPDLPYLSLKTGSVNWADVMHYEKTNSIVKDGHEKIKINWNVKTPTDEAKFVWLMGYVSHLVADATIHPVVEAIVGKYEEHKEDHRLCEMTQDSLIYNTIMKTDIRYSEFSEMLKFCRESEHFDKLMDFWKALVLNNYREKAEDPHLALWFTTYAEAIDTAEGGSELVALFRHIGIAEKYIYRTREEIEKDYSQDYVRYFREVKLPTGSNGNFQKYAFEKAVANVTDAWKKLYEGLKAEIIVAQVIRNWNLDTGIDMDTNIKTYWV